MGRNMVGGFIGIIYLALEVLATFKFVNQWSAFLMIVIHFMLLNYEQQQRKTKKVAILKRKVLWRIFSQEHFEIKTN